MTDANGANLGDVYLRDRTLQTTTLVSHSGADPSTTATGGSSDNPVISDNGAYVVYTSFATNLVTGQADGNGSQDVFVYSVASGQSTLVSHAIGSDSTTCDNGDSQAPDISDDGAFVTYQSKCDNLIANQNPGGDFSNVFLYDRGANTTVDVVSRPNAVNPANVTTGDGDSSNPDISGQGNVIVYTTGATNIGGGGDALGLPDVSYYSRPVGNQPAISRNLTFPGDGFSSRPTVSDDGVYVAFETEASNLVANDSNGDLDIVLSTIPVGQGVTFTSVSQADAANTGNEPSFKAEIAGDASYVAFLTYATDLVDNFGPKNNDAVSDVVRWSRSTQDIDLASHNIPDNAGGNADSGQPGNAPGLGISDDGVTVLFTSEATNLSARQTNGDTQIYVTDFLAGDVTMLSTNANGSAGGNGNARNGSVSSGGQHATFQSDAPDHTALIDANGDPDIFAVGVVLEDDAIVSIQPTSVIEGDEGTTDATFTVTVSSMAATDVTVDYATTDGSATGGPSADPGIDYRTSGGTTTISAGSTSSTITVPVYGDTEIEPDETFTMALSNPSSGGSVSPTDASATGTIIDDDNVIVDGAGDFYDGVNDTLRITQNRAEGSSISTTSPSDVALNYSQALYPTPAPGQPSREALLATDAVFPDSLASGALQGSATSSGRPLLLTGPEVLYPEVVVELNRLDVATVHILGGINAISQDVEDSLRGAGFTVNRYQGPSRLETATAIAGGAYPDATSAILARAFPSLGGDETQAFADSTAAGALAASEGWPLLLSQTDVLSTSTRTYLESSQIQTIYIAGGTAAISPEVETSLTGMGITVVRMTGDSRFDTALAIAAQRGYTSESDASMVMLLDGQSSDAWVAGFTGAGYSAINGAPIVLGVESQVPPQTVAFLAGTSEAPAGATFTVDEANVTGYVLVCGIATERCDEGRGHLGLPSLATVTEPTGEYATGATATFELDGTFDVAGYRTAIQCGSDVTEIGSGGPTAHTGGEPTVSIGATIPPDAPAGPCTLAVVLTYSNGSAQTAAAPVTVTGA